MRQLPNILFLMCDQLRWDALGCVGGWVKTPYRTVSALMPVTAIRRALMAALTLATVVVRSLLMVRRGPV